MIAQLCERFEIGGHIREAALAAHERVANYPYEAQRRVAANVLRAFIDEGIAESDLAGSAGYGYDDAARVRYESLLGRVLGAERVLARLSIVSGTHAIVAALAACTTPGKKILSVAGPPYDTLRNAICDAPGALVRRGIVYDEIPLDGSGDIDSDALEQKLARDDDVTVFIQRSRGYAPRPSLSIAQCERAIAVTKRAGARARVLVDNCYGELVEEREPLHVGADLIMGSLIKNLGGSIAPAGAYVAGRSDLIERVAEHLYAPGLSDRLGPTLGFGRALCQGLFIAPLVVEQALRGLDFVAALFEHLGYAVDPQPGAVRTDIVQAIRLGSRELVQRFAQALQSAMPLNARFTPVPGSVPGYAEPVLMSSGAFVNGATIELSCDAPLREPFEVYVQGGVTCAHAYLGAIFAARALES